MAGERSDDRLQQYFDGELSAADAADVRRELEADAELRAKLEGLAHLRRMVVAASEAQAEELDSEALFAGILGQLGASHASASHASASQATRPALRVVEGGASSRAPGPGATGPDEAGAGRERDRLGRHAADHEALPSERRRRGVWAGVGIVLAVAAAVLLLIARPFEGADSGGAGRDALAANPPPGSEIVEVDFGYSTGAIFSVEGQAGEQYAVVWISDEKIETGGANAADFDGPDFDGANFDGAGGAELDGRAGDTPRDERMQ
jgi:hypothetical protein